MEFLRSFRWRHLAGKPVVASPNVGCFLRLAYPLFYRKKPVSAESTLASDYMRKSWLLCPSQHHLVRALIVKTALAYALIVLPWPKLTQLGKLKCLQVSHHRILKLKIFKSMLTTCFRCMLSVFRYWSSTYEIAKTKKDKLGFVYVEESWPS